MKKIAQFFLIFILFTFFFSCKEWKHYNHDYTQQVEDLIKAKIGHFEDYSLNIEDVSLSKQKDYYIGHAKYQNTAYFVGYIDKNNEVKVCRVFSKEWEKNQSVNLMIIEANNELSLINLNIDTIYGAQENDSIGITLVDSKEFSNSNWDIKKITDIKNFDKYTLTKCFASSCPTQLVINK